MLNYKTFIILNPQGYALVTVQARDYRHALSLKAKYCYYKGYDAGLCTVKLAVPDRITQDYINSLGNHDNQSLFNLLNPINLFRS